MIIPRSHTRGFLFADLRGYTAFTELHGDDAARELIARYRALVRREIAAHDGAEIRTEGDSVYVVFDSVADAVEGGLAIRDAAIAASAEPGAHPIPVGIGIHAGETKDGEEGIVSLAVNIAARVCSVAEPGDVLVTETVRDLVRTSLHFRFVPRGRRRFKGIAQPIALFRVTDAATETMRPSLARQRLSMAGVVLGIAAVGSALVIGLSSHRPAGTAIASPDSDGPRSPAGQPSGSPTDAFPNEAEAALLERLPTPVTTSCDRADPDLVPVRNYFSHDGPLVVVAGVTCITGVTRVVYWEGVRADDVDSAFVREVGNLRLVHGVCGERSRAWQEWRAGAFSGKLLCYSASQTVLEWTYGEEPILAIATRRAGDFDAFVAWWAEIGRLLSR